MEALARIRPAAEAVLDAFREMNNPHEINLEFGIKLSGKLGAIFTAVESEATFKVSLKWKNEPRVTFINRKKADAGASESDDYAGA